MTRRQEEQQPRDVQDVYNDILAAIQLLRINTKEVLTLDEAVAYTGYTKDTLYGKMCHHEIPHYKRGNKAFFRRVELEQWMTRLRIKTDEEIRDDATEYCRTHPMPFPPDVPKSYSINKQQSAL